MKRLSAALLAIGLVSSSAAFAQSGYYPSSQPYPSSTPYQQGEAYYDYARVIRVDPVGGGYRSAATYGNQRCYESQSAGSYQRDGSYYGGNYAGNYGGNGSYYGNDPYARPPQQYGGGTPTGRNVATVIGGIAGAVLGSKVGGGTGSYAATAIGSMVGGMAGRQVYENTQRDRYTPAGTVRVCEPEPVRDGYAGTYGRTSGGQGGYDVTYEYNGRRYTRRMDYNPGARVRVRVDVSPQ